MRLPRACVAGLALAHAALAEPTRLVLEQSIPLPGVSGRFDHLALDVKRERVYLAALGNDTVEVVDLAHGRHLPAIGGCARPTGIAYLPKRDRLAVACSGEGVLRVFDPATRAKVGEFGGLEDADNVRVDADEGRVVVGYGSGSIAVVDLTTERRVLEIPLPGHPEAFQLDSARVFVNLPDRHAIAVRSASKPEVGATWPTGELRANYPMALDSGTGTLWVVFRKPPRLTAWSTTTGTLATEVPTCGDADDVFVDRKRRRVYVACGEGFVDVVEWTGSASLGRAERVETRPGARTALYSDETDALYVALPERGAREAELRIYRPISR